MSLPQAAEEEDDHTVPEVLYGDADLMVVGCQYYRGVAHLGEFVNLVREPNNRYDRNAIRVDNLAGQQVGHIKATQACHLAGVLDDPSRSAPRVEAVVSMGGTRIYNLPIRASVYGPPEKATATLSALRSLLLKCGVSRKLPATGETRYRSGPRVTVSVADPVKTQRELDEMFDKLDSDTPQQPTPETSATIRDVLGANLLGHQHTGLAWMVQRERDPDPTGLPPFWESRLEGGKRVFHNTITNSSQEGQPNSVRGGILADEMGLGKTLQVISLILAEPPAGADYAASVRALEENKRKLEKLNQEEQAAARRESLPEEEADSGKGAASAPAATEVTPEQKQVQVRLNSEKAFKKLKKGELQTELAKKGLSDKGVKDELIKRLARSAAGLPPLQAPPRLPSAGGAAAAGGGGSARVGEPIGTLVVCPMSVMGNWESQIKEHVKEGALKVYAYHGQNRSQDVDFLASCDVVITTYDTLASDFTASGGEAAFGEAAAQAKAAAGVKRKRKQGVMSLGWRRVVLDEAHTIRNPKTGKHKACVALSSTRRWCLTGTPLQNRPADIGSLFTFLRLSPVSDATVFKRAIGRPIESGDGHGLASLRVFMRSLCLRRTKDVLGKTLPPKEVAVHHIEMDEHHQEAYDALFDSSRAAFRAALAAGESEVMSNYGGVLECLLRLRQVCCSSSMVPQSRLEQARSVLNHIAKEGPKLGKQEASKLFAKLKGLLSEPEGAECAVCLEPVEAADARVLRGCGHGLCSKCLVAMCAVASAAADGGSSSGGVSSKCPLCRASFTSKDLISGAELESARAAGDTPDGAGAGARKAGGEIAAMVMPPPKVHHLLTKLNELRQGGSGDKVVVFSQFTSFLNIIQPFLVAEGYRLARIDGTMSNKQRQAALKGFSSSYADSPQVMLASLSAAGTGINLTSANHCFICDPWWNASVEEQAMDRVHRIGQTKKVSVVRLVSANSVEKRMLAIQEAKQALGKGALRKLTPDELRKTRMADLRSIFEC